MTQYINKTTLIAEIEKRIKGLKDCRADTVAGYAGEISGLKNLLSFLDTIETTEVNLEKELDFNAEVSKFIDTFYKNTKIGHKLMIRRTARYFYDLGLNRK